MNVDKKSYQIKKRIRWPEDKNGQVSEKCTLQACVKGLRYSQVSSEC